MITDDIKKEIQEWIAAEEKARRHVDVNWINISYFHKCLL